MTLFLFGFTKTKTGAKTAPREPKLSYFAKWAPQLSDRVNHGTPAAGVVGHMYNRQKQSIGSDVWTGMYKRHAKSVED